MYPNSLTYISREKMDVLGLTPTKIFRGNALFNVGKYPSLQKSVRASIIDLHDKMEKCKRKGYADFFFLVLRVCTPMVEARQCHTSILRKGHFLLQISGVLVLLLLSE